MNGTDEQVKTKGTKPMKPTLTLLTALLPAPLAALHAADAPTTKPNILCIAADKANAALLQQLTQQWRAGWRKALPSGTLN